AAGAGPRAFTPVRVAPPRLPTGVGGRATPGGGSEAPHLARGLEVVLPQRRGPAGAEPHGLAAAPDHARPAIEAEKGMRDRIVTGELAEMPPDRQQLRHVAIQRLAHRLDRRPRLETFAPIPRPPPPPRRPDS